jgi:hypothetical protein
MLFIRFRTAAVTDREISVLVLVRENLSKLLIYRDTGAFQEDEIAQEQ